MQSLHPGCRIQDAGAAEVLRAHEVEMGTDQQLDRR